MSGTGRRYRYRTTNGTIVTFQILRRENGRYLVQSVPRGAAVYVNVKQLQLDLKSGLIWEVKGEPEVYQGTISPEWVSIRRSHQPERSVAWPVGAMYLLVDYLGVLPPMKVVREFVEQFFRPMRMGEWTASEEEVAETLEGVRHSLRVRCIRCADSGCEACARWRKGGKP